MQEDSGRVRCRKSEIWRDERNLVPERIQTGQVPQKAASGVQRALRYRLRDQEERSHSSEIRPGNDILTHELGHPRNAEKIPAAIAVGLRFPVSANLDLAGRTEIRLPVAPREPRTAELVAAPKVLPHSVARDIDTLVRREPRLTNREWHRVPLRLRPLVPVRDCGDECRTGKRLGPHDDELSVRRIGSHDVWGSIPVEPPNSQADGSPITRTNTPRPVRNVVIERARKAPLAGGTKHPLGVVRLARLKERHDPQSSRDAVVFDTNVVDLRSPGAISQDHQVWEAKRIIRQRRVAVAWSHIDDLTTVSTQPSSGTIGAKICGNNPRRATSKTRDLVAFDLRHVEVHRCEIAIQSLGLGGVALGRRLSCALGGQHQSESPAAVGDVGDRKALAPPGVKRHQIRRGAHDASVDRKHRNHTKSSDSFVSNVDGLPSLVDGKTSCDDLSTLE